MNTQKNQNHFLIVLFCTCTLFVNAQKIQDALKHFVNYEGFSGASIGIYAIDVSSQKVVMQYDRNRLLTPASTVKLFSTAFALNILGQDYRSETTLYYNGTIDDNGVLNGDLWLVGSGDLSLGSRYTNSHVDSVSVLFCDFLQRKGIRSINGNIYADGSDFGYQGVPTDWQWGDIGNYYGSHFSGLMLYDNAVEYHFKTKSAGQPAELIYTVPQINELQLTNSIVASKQSGDHSLIFGVPYAYEREARGTLPENTSNFVVKGSIPDPEQQWLNELYKNMVTQGITISGELRTTRLHPQKRPIDTWQQVFTRYGNTIFELATLTNHHSINVFAEGLMRITAFQHYKYSLHDDACKTMQNYWREKLKTEALFINDGSGLSRTNAMSAKTLCDLLVYMHTSNFIETLPIAGESGTLKNISKNQPAHGKIRAKSGSMRRVRAYAGYALVSDDKKIAFAVIVNNFTCSNKRVTQQMEKLMNAFF